MEKNFLFPIPLLTPALFRRSHTSHQNVDVEIWIAPEQSASNDAFGKRWTGKRWTELYFGDWPSFVDFSFLRRVSLVHPNVAIEWEENSVRDVRI